jgi:hypothetical protein
VTTEAEHPVRPSPSSRRRRRGATSLVGLAGVGLALGVALVSAPAQARSPQPSAASPTTHAGFDRPAPAVTREDARTRRQEKRRALPHRGTVIEASIGPLGCDGVLCGGSSLDTQPGFRVGGFFGGNIHGWVEMGVTGGWGMMKTRTAGGMNPLSMYGLDVGELQDVLTAAAALGYADIDLQGYTVGDAALQTAQAGPLMRLHFNPRGRFMAWAGSGATYHLLRNDFATERGRVRLDTHGFAVPIEAGLGIAVHEHFAVVATGSYLWTWALLSGIDLPDRELMVPTKLLQRQAVSQGSDLVGKLPNFWTMSAGIRTRF